MYWLDYSAAKLSGATIKAAGYGGVIRYIDAPNLLGRKHTSKAEYDDHVRNGLQVRLVMQTTTTASDGGRTAGIDHATRALAGAEYLGYRGPIYFTNDRTTLPSSTTWDDYLTGAASVLGWGRVGAYGFANAMDVAAHMTDCQHFWQSGRKSDVRPFVQIWQDNNTQVTVGGILCDRNLILKDLEGDDVELTDPIKWGDGREIPLKDLLAQLLVNSNRLVGLPNRTASPWGNLPPDSVEPVAWVEQVKTDAGITRATVLPLADDENKLTFEIRGAKDELAEAILNLPPQGAPTDEQIQVIVDKLNAKLGGAYEVTITPKLEGTPS